MAYQKFYELDIWKAGFELQKELFRLTRRFPKEESFGLISQVNRSTNSVIANIAESHGRYYFLDKIRVLYIARGEIEEMQSHIFVSASRGYINDQVKKELVDRYELLKIGLNRYIADYSRQKQEQ